MYPASFDYYRAGSVQEAIALLQQHGDDAKLLAGGHSLIPTMKLRLAQPGVLIDIGRLSELRYVRAANGGLAIGAGTTYYQVETSAEVNRVAPLLAQTANRVGDLQVRNCGTVGGSLAHNDPTADLPAAFLALDGEVTVRGPRGERTIKATDLFVDLLTTSIQPGEILTELRVQGQGARTGAAYVKQPNPASGYAICGIAAVVGLDASGNVSHCRVAITGVGPKATRATAVEQAVTGGAASDERIAAAAAKASDGLETMGDLHGSEEYRAHLARVLTRRALQAAAAQAKG